MIFGVSSFLGSNLVEILKDEYRVIGTYRSTPVSIPGVTCVPCDVLRKDYVSNLIAIFRPDITIYAAGMSSLKECQLHPKAADALNSVGAINCCVAAERYGSKFVFFSSGYVLGGEKILYREGDTPFPETVFGNSLSSTEFYIQRSCLNYLIFRCSPLYGRSYNPTTPNWFEAIQSAFAKGEAIHADDSVSTGFMDIQQVGKILKATLAKNVTNRLFHISSKDFMTRYEFAKLYAKIFKKDEALIQKTSGTFPVDTNKNHRSKSSDMSAYYFQLDTANIEEFLGVQMPKIEDSLNMTYKRLNSINLAG